MASHCNQTVQGSNGGTGKQEEGKLRIELILRSNSDVTDDFKSEVIQPSLCVLKSRNITERIVSL